MDTNTTATVETTKPLSVKELSDQRKSLREQAKSISTTLTQKREEAKAKEQEDAKNSKLFQYYDFVMKLSDKYRKLGIRPKANPKDDKASA